MPEQKWSQAEITRVWSMFGDGCSDSEIGSALGLSARSVANKRHTLGIVRYSRPTRPRGDGAKHARRAKALLDLVELALAGADAKAPHAEIADDLRRGLRNLPG